MLTEGTEGWRVEGVEEDGEGKKCAPCDSKCFCLKWNIHIIDITSGNKRLEVASFAVTPKQSLCVVKSAWITAYSVSISHTSLWFLPINHVWKREIVPQTVDIYSGANVGFELFCSGIKMSLSHFSNISTHRGDTNKVMMWGCEEEVGGSDIFLLVLLFMCFSVVGIFHTHHTVIIS